MRCAVVLLDTHRVVNIILAAPDNAPPTGCVLIAVDSVTVDIGYIWDGERFFDPDPYSQFRIEAGALVTAGSI